MSILLRVQTSDGKGGDGAALTMPLAAGDAGTMQTLDAMAAIVHQGTSVPAARELASHLWALAKSDKGHYPRQVYNWLQRNTKYTPDPEGIELVRTVPRLLDMLGENQPIRCDCDEVAVLGATLLKLAKIKTGFIVVGDSAYRHVFYGGVDLAGTPYPFDPQERFPPGVRPQLARSGWYLV